MKKLKIVVEEIPEYIKSWDESGEDTLLAKITLLDDTNELHKFIIYVVYDNLLLIISDLIKRENLPGNCMTGTGQFEISYDWKTERVVNLLFDFGEGKGFNIRVFLEELFEIIRDFGLQINNIFQDRGQSKEESESFLQRLNEISILYEEWKKKRDDAKK